MIFMLENVKKRWNNVEHAPISLQDIKCVTFSDNIAIALELSEDLEEDEFWKRISDFILYISVVQGAGLKNCLWFRGGITIGKLYIDSDSSYVWGKALVDAHDLEAKYAKYPRVIIDSNMKIENLPVNSRIVKDLDNRYFVDYVSAIKKTQQDWIDKNIAMIHATENIEDKRVLEKYHWFLQYVE